MIFSKYSKGIISRVQKYKILHKKPCKFAKKILKLLQNNNNLAIMSIIESAIKLVSTDKSIKMIKQARKNNITPCKEITKE